MPALVKKISQPWSETGKTVYCIIRIEADGYYLNDADGAFANAPADPYVALTEDGTIKGLYELSESRTAWADGDYFVFVYRQTGAGPVPASDMMIGYSVMTILSDAEATVADTVWDEVITSAAHGVADSGATYLRNLYQTLVTRIAQCAKVGSATTIILDASASQVADYYKGQVIAICGGTGAGQARACTGYAIVGGDEVATIGPAWATTPDATSWFAVLNVGSAVVSAIDNFDFSTLMKTSLVAAMSGAGAISWPFIVTNATTGAPIDGAEVWVTTDTGGTNIIASGTTDASGTVTFLLDAGIYCFWVKKAGFNFPGYKQETVA